MQRNKRRKQYLWNYYWFKERYWQYSFSTLTYRIEDIPKYCRPAKLSITCPKPSKIWSRAFFFPKQISNYQNQLIINAIQPPSEPLTNDYGLILQGSWEVMVLSSVLSRPCPRYSFAEQILLSRPCPREGKKREERGKSKGERRKEKGERRKEKGERRLVKLDELANNFAIKREQNQTTQERTQNQTCLNYAERQGGKQ